MTSTRAAALMTRAFVGASLVAVLTVPAGAESASSLGRAHEAASVPGEIVVRYRPGTGESSRYSVRAATGVTLVSRLSIERTELVDVGTEDLATAIARISARPEVLYAEPNFIYQGAATPDDASFQELWGMDNQGQEVLGLAGRPDADIDATEAWDRSTGDHSVLVAVVDSGVVADHPDLASNIWTNPGEEGLKADNGQDDDDNEYVDDWRGWDFVSGDNLPDDEHGHGTHVAGTIGARGNDGFGVAGVSWDVSLLPVRVLAADNTGTLADIAAGMDYASLMGARVANVSIQSTAFSKLMRDAIAEHPGTLYVIAAGNGGSDGAGDDNDVVPTYPCAYPQANILCVAATDQNDRLTGFSNYGTGTVDLAAPGQDVLSSQPTNATPFNEFFDEEDLARWSTGGKKNSWARVEDQFGGGRLEDSPQANYASNTNSWAMTEPLDLSGTRNCRLSYDLDLAVRQGDSLIVEATSDGDQFERINEWSFRTHGWIYGTRDDLGGFAGEPAFQLRFRLKSDDGGNSKGTKIDNLFIECLGSDYTSESFTYMSGTSMATPHAAGVAALAFAEVPSATLAMVKEAMLASVDVRPDLVGLIKTGGRLNAERTLALLTEPPGTAGPEVVCVPAPPLSQPSLKLGDEQASGAPAGDFGSTTLDETSVYDEVDAAFGPGGLHVVGSTGDDAIRYFDPTGTLHTIADVDLTHSGVALGVLGDDSPVIGYHDRLVAEEDGRARLCEANMVATGPVFDPRVADVVDKLNGSFRSFDLAVDPIDDLTHRVFAKGKRRSLFYASDIASEELPLAGVDEVKVAASNGAVVIAAHSGSDLHVFTGGPGAWQGSVVATGVKVWDLDIGSDGEPKAVWTNSSGKLRLFDGTTLTKLKWKAAEVSIAAAPNGTMHVAVGTAFPYCKGFGCWKVGYLEKESGTAATRQTLAGTPGYVTSLAIAASDGEVAIVYGDPSDAGHLVAQRASL
ncbi:MAG: S8 family serine peptidase [Actinobacteria bacterium]|nr:S8 family serine peptidase [Actinomycetota bacterium]